MSNFQASTLRPVASHSKLNSSSVPPARRFSAYNSKTPSKDRLHPRDSSSFQHSAEALRKTLPADTPKGRPVASQPIAHSNFMKIPKYHQFMNRTQGAPFIRRSQLRVPKIWEHPEETKFRGLWQQFEDLWFGIHSDWVAPLLEDFPLPTITKSLNDVSESSQEKPDLSKETLTPQPDKKRKEYQIRLLSNKLKKIEQDLIPCDHCKERKRRGTQIECKHYFCRDCLRDHVQSHIDHMKVPIKCMVPNCNHELNRVEIVKNASNSEHVMKYFDLNVADYVRRRPHKMIQCFTDGCKHVIDLTRLRAKNVFRCPSCKFTYCIACHKQIKRGHACEDLNNIASMNGPLGQLLTAQL